MVWKRDDDFSGLGDWFVNEKKLCGTLSELVKEVHDMGLSFGLWFEPEMISEDSDLYRAHRDWALVISGKTADQKSFPAGIGYVQRRCDRLSDRADL